MAGKLLSYFEEAKKLGGLKAQMRMAILTKLPSTKASLAPDSSENVQIFEKAIQEIRKEF